MDYVNAHIHSPYSFSAFDSIEQSVRLAKEENVVALGISDFNTLEGYSEFAEYCGKYRVYPLFNIEFIALSQEDQQKGNRWNDPKNPGIMYFCGKGLRYPTVLSNDSRNRLRALWKGSQDRMWKMIGSLNGYIHERGIDISLDYNYIRTHYAKNTVRERHIAKALYLAFTGKFNSTTELTEKFRRLFNDESFDGDFSDSASIQNEIRSRLLKAGKPAFIEEKPEAFLPFHTIKGIILEGGGIPCYPVLADDKAGLTEYEKDVFILADKLIEMGVFAVEFIPLRNSFNHLKNYVRHFHERGFCVTFGTEHNTPERLPLIPTTRGGRPFDDELMGIAYDGACIIAAHQEERRKNKPGFVNEYGTRIIPSHQIRKFIDYGAQVIQQSVT